MASLAFSIGCISFLNRFDETIVPSWPEPSITTGTPPTTVAPPNAVDKGFGLTLADADRSRLAGETKGTNIDVAIACGKTLPCTLAQRDVEVAGGVVKERLITVGRVEAAGVVETERTRPMAVF